MHRVHRSQGIAVLLATACAGSNASANDGPSEIVYVVPIVGVEYVGIASAALHADYQGVDTTRTSGVGLAWGGHAGVALGAFRLGALFQQTRVFQTDGLNFNKLYVEAGLGGRQGIVALTLTLAGGWAFFSGNGMSRRDGGGARVAFAADFYIGRFFSLGPELAVDGAGYVADQTAYGSWGVTGALRVGLHL